MAAPHVAGALALLREEYPNASANDLEAKLRNGAPSVIDGRTGTSLAALEVAHTLPGGPGGPVAVAAAPVKLTEQSFIIQTSSSDQQVANSVQSACPNESCELKQIGDGIWKLDVPLQAAMSKGKAILSPADVRQAMPSLASDTKVFANTPAAAISAKAQ